MNSLSSVSSRVVDIISDIAEERVELDTRIWDEDVIDSLGLFELFFRLEDEFNVKFDVESFDRDRWATPQMIIDELSTCL